MNTDDKKTILLVEDDIITAMLELQELNTKNYLVHHVTSGEEAIKTIFDDYIHFDLILMDIDLGSGIDGTQAAEQILKQEDIPIIFLSSHTETEVVERTEKITSYGYVVKNTGIIVLDASIKMALRLFSSKLREKEKDLDLKKSEERYRRIFETAPIAIIFTRGTDILYANQSYLSMYGISSLSELQNYEPVQLFTPEWRPKIIENIRRRAEGLPVPNSYKAECFKKDGTIFPVYMHFTRTDFTDGPATIGFIIDMTSYDKA